MSKTNEKKGFEGGMGYCVNALKTIGNTDFEGEALAHCANPRKTANICKRKTAGMLHTENNQQDCGAPPPLGEDWSIINEKLTSTTTNVLGNRKNLHIHQEEQVPQSYCSNQEGIFFPAEMKPPGKHQNNM